MKDRKILLLLALLGAASAFGSNNDPGSGGGGTTVGNGGSGIECAGKIEVLEIYEARLKGYQDFLPALDDADTLRAARAALAPWKRERTPHDGLITYAYADFQTGLDEFWRNVHLSDAPLPSIEDQGPMPALAPGCRRVQIAAQNTDLNRRLGKTYLIDKSLWERLDNLNRAALVVHEVLYTTLLSWRPRDSSGLRSLTTTFLRQKLGSRPLGEVPLVSFHRQLFLWGFLESRFLGFRVATGVMSEDGSVRETPIVLRKILGDRRPEATLPPGSTFEWEGSPWKIQKILFQELYPFPEYFVFEKCEKVRSLAGLWAGWAVRLGEYRPRTRWIRCRPGLTALESYEALWKGIPE